MADGRDEDPEMAWWETYVGIILEVVVLLLQRILLFALRRCGGGYGCDGSTFGG